MQIGAQLFTMRTFMETEKDVEYTLEKIAQMGYKTVQVSGVKWAYEPKKLRQMCDKNDLKIVLTHTAQDKVLNNIDQVIEDHNILGADYIGIGSMPDKYRDPKFIHRFAEDYIPVAEKIKAAGKYFMYHNHAFEFEKFDGKFMMDILLDSMPADLMGVTLDTYWLQVGGVNILSWLDKLQDRIPCVHLKDLKVSGKDQTMAAVGDGNIDFAEVLKKLEDLGKTKYALVEQDNCNGLSPYDCMATSYKNLSALGYK